jgi:hypothetical protein
MEGGAVMHIKQVGPPDEKTAVTLKIMRALPAWFNPPEDWHGGTLSEHKSEHKNDGCRP